MNATTPSEFAAECEVILNLLDPELVYRRPDLYGFVTACWPTNDTPADVACEFSNSIRKQATRA